MRAFLIAAFLALASAPLSAHAQDAGGSWRGIYEQAGAQTQFTAEFSQSGTDLIGVMSEMNADQSGGFSEHRARVAGSVKGGALQFFKTYDGTGGWDHQVAYVGAISEDGNQIAGHWSLPFSGETGEFIMQRASKH